MPREPLDKLTDTGRYPLATKKRIQDEIELARAEPRRFRIYRTRCRTRIRERIIPSCGAGDREFASPRVVCAPEENHFVRRKMNFAMISKLTDKCML